VSKSRSAYPSLSADRCGRDVVSHGGAVVLLRTAERTGLTSALSFSVLVERALGSALPQRRGELETHRSLKGS
jgi:hypothetical protein